MKKKITIFVDKDCNWIKHNKWFKSFFKKHNVTSSYVGESQMPDGPTGDPANLSYSHVSGADYFITSNLTHYQRASKNTFHNTVVINIPQIALEFDDLIRTSICKVFANISPKKVENLSDYFDPRITEFLLKRANTISHGRMPSASDKQEYEDIINSINHEYCFNKDKTKLRGRRKNYGICSHCIPRIR